MKKCAICGKEMDELYECDYCGNLICADCGGEDFYCDSCFDEHKQLF